MKTHNHILFNLSAKLLIAASVLCVLFGNGTHLHTVFNHFSEHSDIHIYVHAHPADASHGHTPEFDDNETHLHPTATVELEGRLTQKTVHKHKPFADENTFTEAGKIPGVYSIEEANLLFLDLPPPDFLTLPEYFSSLKPKHFLLRRP